MKLQIPLSAAILGAAVAASVAGCSAPSPSQYAGQLPRLDVERYFDGALEAHGMFQDRSGAVVKRFVVSVRGSWQGDDGKLEEDFTYADGTRQQRTWRLHKSGAGRLTATAPDVVGVAQGTVTGNALHWRYVLALPVDGRVIKVDMDDWMFLIDGRVMLNRTAMSKFGVNLGSVTLSFNKQGAR